MILLPSLYFIAAGLSFLLGAGVALRSRREVPRWAFVVTLFALSAEALCSGMALLAATPLGTLHWQQHRSAALALLPSVLWLFSATYGRYRDVRWLRRHVWIFVALCLPLVLLALLRRDDLFSFPRHSRTESYPVLYLAWGGMVLMLSNLIVSIVALLNLERTFRAAVGTTRWRLKYIMLGFVVLLGVRLYTSSQVLLFKSLGASLESLDAAALLLGGLLMLRGLLRTGHFDLQVYPSQAVLHHSLTFLVAGTYLVLVGGFARLATSLGRGFDVAVGAFLLLAALVGLAVFLQSDRARLRLRQFVSHHFQRPLHDYRAVWRKFTEGTASHVDEEALARSLVRLISEVFEALSVTLWLCDEKRERLRVISSTHTTAPETADKENPGDGVSRLLAHFQKHRDPADFEDERAHWAEALRRLHPRVFPNGGRRVVVPLFGRDTLLGLITIGDRVGGVPFVLQDLEMLKCVGDHAAANLLNRQLSHQLVQNREMAAFQAMATFFIHDLKNAASTLTLMLQNFPKHWEDPTFRADALRGIDRTVTHINQLIVKLGQLRHDQKLRLQPFNLNALVRDVVQPLDGRNGLRIGMQLGDLPAQPLDREQLAKVVTNLVINAIEAVGPKGEIVLRTTADDRHTTLTVSDNGCGMSEQFIRESLFRPFQTTKKGGLGIGMFQSKTIVSAHGGRLEVASIPGKGTMFTLTLPLGEISEPSPIQPQALPAPPS